MFNKSAILGTYLIFLNKVFITLFELKDVLHDINMIPRFVLLIWDLFIYLFVLYTQHINLNSNYLYLHISNWLYLSNLSNQNYEILSFIPTFTFSAEKWLKEQAQAQGWAKAQKLQVSRIRINT